MADHLSDLAGASPASTQQLLQAALADLTAVRQELEQERLEMAEVEAWRDVLRLQQKREEEWQLEILWQDEQLRRGSETRRRLEKQLGGRSYALIERLVPMDGDSGIEAGGGMPSERFDYQSSLLH